MLKEGDKLICKTKGLPETEFCIRGVVKSVVGDKVTISRALKFGQLPMDEDLTLPEEELLKYYTLMDESEASTQGMIYEVTVSRFGFVFVAQSLLLPRWSWRIILQPSISAGQMTGCPPMQRNMRITMEQSLQSLISTDQQLIVPRKENVS